MPVDLVTIALALLLSYYLSPIDSVTILGHHHTNWWIASVVIPIRILFQSSRVFVPASLPSFESLRIRLSLDFAII